MKIVTANGKEKLKISKKDWLAIGNKAGWTKQAGFMDALQQGWEGAKAGWKGKNNAVPSAAAQPAPSAAAQPPPAATQPAPSAEAQPAAAQGEGNGIEKIAQLFPKFENQVKTDPDYVLSALTLVEETIKNNSNLFAEIAKITREENDIMAEKGDEITSKFFNFLKIVREISNRLRLEGNMSLDRPILNWFYEQGQSLNPSFKKVNFSPPAKRNKDFMDTFSQIKGIWSNIKIAKPILTTYLSEMKAQKEQQYQQQDSELQLQ